MFITSSERHSSDGDLIRLLDRESDSVDSATVAHVDSCGACSARLAGLQQRDERFSATLRALDVPAIDRDRLVPSAERIARARTRARRRVFWSHSGLRAAAAILVLAGVAAASPARAWILSRVVGGRGEHAPSTPSASSASPHVQTPVQSPGSIVRFASDSDELLIRFDARPMRGTLRVLAGREPRSSAQILSGARGESFLVLPRELRVRNAAGSVADYAVTLAPTVRRVRVHVGSTGAIAPIDLVPGMERVIQLRAGEQSP